jgi:hypothetical protein
MLFQSSDTFHNLFRVRHLLLILRVNYLTLILFITLKVILKLPSMLITSSTSAYYRLGKRDYECQKNLNKYGY